MNSSYLLYPSLAALCAAAWHDMDTHSTHKDAFWHPRFCVVVPNSLLRKVYAKALRQLQHGINQASGFEGPASCRELS